MKELHHANQRSVQRRLQFSRFKTLNTSRTPAYQGGRAGPSHLSNHTCTNSFPPIVPRQTPLTPSAAKQPRHNRKHPAIITIATLHLPRPNNGLTTSPALPHPFRYLLHTRCISPNLQSPEPNLVPSITATMSDTFTTKQVAEHKDVEKGLYIIIDEGVYKMDTFVDEHPGGAKILKRVGGKDASKQFWKVC